jgi:hypothetical protein
MDIIMKTLRFIFVFFLVFPVWLKAQVVHGQDWVLINSLGTVEVAHTDETQTGQLFSIAGYRHEEIPILGETFARNFSETYKLPQSISVEFLLESFANLDSLEIYLSIGDTVILERWCYVWQRYLVDLGEQDIWLKAEWKVYCSSLEGISRIGFLFELYSPKGMQTSCQIYIYEESNGGRR